MSDEGLGSISRIVSGSAIIFAGSILHKLIAFGGSIFIARALGDTGYGIVVVALSMLFVFGELLNLGMGQGVSRNYPRAETDQERRGILLSALQLSIILSVFGGVGVFLAAEPLAVRVFNDPSLIPVLEVVAVVVPLYSLRKVSNGGLQAVKKPAAKALISSIFQPIVRIVFIVVLVTAGFEAVGVASAYVVATGTAAFLALYVVHRETDLFAIGTPAARSYRSLLAFSLPLVGSAVIMRLMNNVDTLLIGTLQASADVGQYNVAFVLGQTTLLFYQTLGFMYVPELSELHKEGAIDQASMIYQAVTKWVVLASVPFILTAVVFPETVISLLYSEIYLQATLPFLILIGGFLTHILVGPNINTLTSFGDTREIFIFDAGTVGLNIVLNLVLIPRFGIAGAATATSASYVVRNGVMTWFLHRTYGIMPFSRQMLLPLIPTVLVAGLLWFVVEDNSVLLVIVSAFALVATTTLGYLSSGIEKSDMMLAETIESQTGIDLHYIRQLHDRIR
ncbi:oligosaccharide flippase family protein [Halobaculum sp. WSA2]|uniref:Oligosaccharide flippase family protein n=1 Tax=Halobaculum saliterrae TaxID=2073113 RepID=A0A6B0ST58_9EURY|nr:oligosaccharide flippase family protein [Halobaculum saliterrae]MXR41865.1 oligosaccharide flippase family protein [Halobaculum saliterrae]